MPATFPIAFGRYQLVERLALGGMAELFLARVTGDHGFAKTVVIKRILPHLAADHHFTQMFIAEAKITARLAHPKIAQTHRLGREEGQLFIEMEYIDGLDVLAMLRECAHRRVRMPAEVSVFVIKEVLDALDYAHRLRDDSGHPFNVVHRDVSPSNVLVSRRGNVKLVDFGIAHAAQQEQHTQAGTLKGKYGYMSPEQITGMGVTAKSDLFSVAVVLAEMLMGRRLFAAPNELDVLLMVRDVNLSRLERYGAHIPAELGTILRRCLRKAPEERFAGAGEMRDALDEWLFESRLRVTPGRLAELVESLYEDAQQRRRAGMDEAPPPPANPAQIPLAAQVQAVSAAGEVGARGGGDRASGADVHAFTARPAEGGEIDGIPMGRSHVLGGADALSDEEIELAVSGVFSEAEAGAEPQAEAAGGDIDIDIELTDPGDAGPGPAGKGRAGAGGGSSSRAPTALGKRARAGGDDERQVTTKMRPIEAAPRAVGSAPATVGPDHDDELTLSEEIVVDLDGLDDSAEPPGLRAGAEAVPMSAAMSMQVRGGRGRLADDGIPISIEEGEHSIRYPTISAAVASVSPPEPDPASRDFDDTNVSGVVEPAADVRSGRIRLPTAEEIARTPKPQPPPMAEIHETPAQQGDLATTSPIKILFQLVSTRADGLLVVSVGGIRKEIYIKSGMPTFVSSNMAGELFGAYLVAEGAISSGELDMALAMMPHFGGKLGDTLVGLGLMKPLDVFRLLTRQVRQKLIDVCTWSKGAYTWYPWRENLRESFPLDFDPYEVLGAGAMCMREDVLWHWSDSLAGIRPRAAMRSDVRPEQFKLGPIAREVYGRLDGQSTVTEMVTTSSSQEQRLNLLRVLFLFWEIGLAEAA